MGQKFQLREYGESNSKVVFLFGGWKYRGYMVWPIAKVLAANGYHCVAYWYDDDIFTPNHAQTVKDMLKVCDDALARAYGLTLQGKDVFAVCGASLGSVYAVLFANALPQVHKVILNTAGADVAAAVWGWSDNAKSYFKKDLIRQGLNLERLAESWRAISPIRNVDNFAGKQVLLYLAEKDEVIAYELGLELVKELRAKGAECHIETNRHLNHAGANLYNFARPAKYLAFLKQGRVAKAAA